ncbi:MAG: molybdopterin-dependent oxidoreductase [Eggerthellaceae bacterium]|nr:molybdopterin-dependent oxidoreductase [Eggerthellaceae bacterium]
MSENAITRRSFLAGSAGVAAVAAAGFTGFGAWQQAHADEEAGTGRTDAVHTLCNACSSKCGYTAYVVDGKLTKLIGDENNPNAEGHLCARGYGYSQIAYSKDRLTDPLKKNAQGKFEAITWDQAYAEIGEKVKAIIAENGPEAIGLVQDPRPSGSYYCNRFIAALGSPNTYTHGAACNLSKASGITQAIGTGDWVSDVANSQMTMFIGRSYCDGIRPSQVAALERAHENGAYIVMVDPRCNNSTVFADEWVPITPGTDLALVLAMSNVLIKNHLYDAEFVAANSVGFDDWAVAIEGCTPAWAEQLTGIPANTIESLAARFAEAAPAASIEPSWRGAYGCAYANSGETARAVALFNTLLGCWNQPGGALLTSGISAGKLDDPRFAAPPKVEAKKLGSEEYPLASASMGSAVYAGEMAKTGALKGMFFYYSNMAVGYSNPAYLADALSNLELMVVCDVQMSETAMLADYVLPETSYLERSELPEFGGGRVPYVALRSQVLDVIHPNTRSCDQIFTELAEACGVGEYFQFTQDELAEAQLNTVGLTLEGLRQVGTVQFPDKAFVYGKQPTFNTPAKKVQFTSEACAKAGLSPCPVWIEPQDPVGEGEYRLVGGKQAIMTHTQTANVPELMNIAEEYGLMRPWISVADAEALGIKDNDEIVVENDLHSGTSKVRVTERISPGVVYLPSHYGCTSPEQHTAYGKGLRIMDYVPFHIEPAYGSTMSQNTTVRIKKVGA